MPPGKGRAVGPRAADDRRPGSKLPIKCKLWLDNVATETSATVSGSTERKRDWLIEKVALYKRVREGCRDASRREYAVGYEGLSGVGVAGHLDI